MSDRERSDTGQFVETVRLEDVVGVFDAVRGPAITSSDVADRLECTTEAARQKLTRLYDRGEVDKRKSGRTTLWWYTGGERITPDERTGATGARESAESADEEEPATSPADTPDRESDTVTAESGEDLVEDVRAYLEDTDQPPKTAHGRDVVLDVLGLLQEHGTLSTGDLQDAIYPDYTDHWGSARTMWNAIDRYLKDVPGIEKGGYGEWTYAGAENTRAEITEKTPVESGDVYDPTEEF